MCWLNWGKSVVAGIPMFTKNKSLCHKLFNGLNELIVLKSRIQTLQFKVLN